MSRIDESRLQLIRTVSHELANVLNTLNFTFPLVTAGNDEAMRSEMRDVCQRNIDEMNELLNDLKDYSVLIAGAASLQIEEFDVRVFGSTLEASFNAITQSAGIRLDFISIRSWMLYGAIEERFGRSLETWSPTLSIIVGEINPIQRSCSPSGRWSRVRGR